MNVDELRWIPAHVGIKRKDSSVKTETNVNVELWWIPAHVGIKKNGSSVKTEESAIVMTK